MSPVQFALQTCSCPLSPPLPSCLSWLLEQPRILLQSFLPQLTAGAASATHLGCSCPLLCGDGGCSGMFCLPCASPHTALRSGTTAPHLELSLLLETAPMIIPGIKQALGNSSENASQQTLCFLKFLFARLSPTPRCAEGEAFTALVGHCCTRAILSHCRTSSTKQLAKSLHSQIPHWALFIRVSCS